MLQNNYLPVISSGIVNPNTEENWKDSLPISMKRRDPRIWQMAYVSARRALDNAPTDIKINSIVTGTALGALNETVNYLDGVFKDGFGSPRNFIASVHNSMAGKLALEFKITGPNITVCESQNSFASSLVTASLLDDDSFPALIICVDENINLLKKLVPHFSKECKTFLSEDWQDSSVAFIVDKPSNITTPSLKAFGPYQTNAKNSADIFRSWIDDDNNLIEQSTIPESFIKPAIIAYDILNSKKQTTAHIPSYSPTENACALVTVCA